MADSDVIIIGRGGGSIEDLWAFNDEELALEIFKSKIPVVSAVGHETDFTIADFVADVRAPTPSAAAELCTPDISTELPKMKSAAEMFRGAALRFIESHRQDLDLLMDSSVLSKPAEFINIRRQDLDMYRADFIDISGRTISDKTAVLSTLAAKLDALSPLKTLARGYSVVFDLDGTAVKSAGEALKLKTVEIQFESGRAAAEIKEILKD